MGEKLWKSQRVFELHKRFKDGRENVEDDDRNHSPRCHRTDENVHLDRRLNTNVAYYMEILRRLRQAVNRTRPEPWPNDWILRHDKTPAHKALFVKQCVAQKSITEMEHPPYSPDLAPNDL
jgi:hypothetical protein